MDRRTMLAGLGAALAAGCSPPAPATQDGGASAPANATAAPQEGPDPAAFVRALYRPYEGAGALPDLLTLPAWSASMRGALDAMRARNAGAEEPTGLDFDPFVNGQDWSLSDVRVTADGVVFGSHAVVRAAFINSGTPETILFDLVWEGGGWRIDNIRQEGWDLRQIVQEGA